MKVAELFEGVDTPRKRPQSMIQFGAKVAAEQLRKMGLSVRIDTRVIGKHEKSDRTVMTVSGDVEEAEILKILKKNKVEYATVGSTTKDGKKSRMIRLVTPSLREAVAGPLVKFKKGQIVTVKKTGEKVEVMSQSEDGLVFTASKDALKVPNDKKIKIVPGKGYKEYMPRELE